jgi:hypothetical protein
LFVEARSVCDGPVRAQSVKSVVREEKLRRDRSKHRRPGAEITCGARRSGFDQAAADGVAYQTGGLVDIQFVHDA